MTSPQYKWEVQVRYSRHPFHADGSLNVKVKESATWFCTVYDEKQRLTERQAAAQGRKLFISSKIQHLNIDNVRVTKRERWSDG